MNEHEIKQAERDIRNAWVVGLISAGITLIFTLIGSSNEAFRHQYGYNAWSLLDVALILGLTYGIFKKSRFSALAMLIYFIVSKIILAAGGGSFGSSVVGLIVTYFFFKATLSTFRLHKHAIETGKLIKKKLGPLMYVAVCGVTLVILAAVVLIILFSFGPEAEAVPGKHMKAKYISAIQEMGLLDSDEEILYFYSDALFDFKKGFYFFTNKKVVLYSKDYEIAAIIISYSDIKDINFKHSPSAFEDSFITLVFNDDTGVFFPVSSDNEGDKKFYELLLSTWQREREGAAKDNF